MEPDDDKIVLQHLLNLEAEASALVDGAQAEADHRISEAEVQCRIAYDKKYSEEIERLEAAYKKEIEQAHEDYKNGLKAYREELMSRSVNRDAFNTLARQFLGRK